MRALANTLERLTLLVETVDEKVWGEVDLDDFEDLFELADDAYMATLDTHVASLEYARLIK